MKTLKFPDDGTLVGGGPGQSCMRHGDPCRIVFNAAGYLSHDNPNSFHPHGLPTGYFGKGSVIILEKAATHDQTVKIFFLEKGKQQSVQHTLDIQKPADCREQYPPDSPCVEIDE